jgi:DNA polymerase-1
MPKLLKIALDTEYDEVTKVPFIATMSDGDSSALLFPDDPKDYFTIKRISEDPNITKIFHSATSDIYALSRIGINVKSPYEDTFIMASIIDENFNSKRLKDLAKRYLKEPCKEKKELDKAKRVWKKKLGKEFRWSKIPKEIIEPYAVKDAEYTIGVYDYLLPRLGDHRKIYEMELELIPIITAMEQRGHRIDRIFCQQEMDRLKQIHQYYYDRITHIVGKCVNYNSPKVLKQIIQDQDIVLTQKTASGKSLSTNKDILEPLAKEHNIIQYILNCRNIDKQIGTYYEPMLTEYTSPNNSIAHFSFWQSGTKSGRFSAELIQTIPKENNKREISNSVRRAFIPRPGFLNFYFDYNQIEMRLFAHYTKNESLIRRIIDGFDPHDGTAIDIFGQEKYDNDPKYCRKAAKTLNFGMIYGMGSSALAAKLDMPFRDANMIMADYDHAYHVRSFIQKMTSLLFRQGYIELDFICRQYHVPKNLAYKAVNILCQGSAAYIIKLAMIRLKDLFQSRYPEARMLIQMHDELAIEIPANIPNIREFVMDVKNTMEDHTTFRVPMTVSVDWSNKSWLDKKTWRYQ